MSLRTAESVRNAAVAAIASIPNGGTIEFRTGNRPGSVTGSAAGTLLAAVDLESPAFGSESGGEVSAAGVPLTTTGADDGTIGHARILDSGGNPVWDEDDIGTSSGNAITVNTLTVSTGVDFQVTSYEFFVADPS